MTDYEYTLVLYLIRCRSELRLIFVHLRSTIHELLDSGRLQITVAL